MDLSYSFPSGGGQPLLQVSPERENRKLHLIQDENRLLKSMAHQNHTRESSVHERAAIFDVPISQAKVLERKTNDAALRRAMLGREEAEAELSKYKDEVRVLRKKDDESLLAKAKMEEKYLALTVCCFHHTTTIIHFHYKHRY